jgi:CRISPR-associated endonuclease Csn1
MKKILGLDLGTNSIGAAVINIPDTIEEYGTAGNIEWVGSRIISTDGYVSSKTGKAFKENPLDTFSKGIGISKAATRRIKRSSRRLKQRYVLRRTRLIKVFKILEWLPKEFPESFKAVIRNNENFKFKISDYLPATEKSVEEAKELLGTRNNKGEIKLPEDWIVYYLRKKGLTEKLSFAELARIIYMMNQRRGFKSSRKDLKDESIEEKKWVEILKIKSVEQETFEPNKNKNFKFKITPYSNKVQPWSVERKEKPVWEEKEFTFLITEKIKIKNDGKKEVIQLTPQLPKEDDWALCVTAQDNKIGEEFPGTYFFNGLVNSVKSKTDFKIRQYAVYRSKYKRELHAIWQKQLELNEELRTLNNDKILLRKIAGVLYPKQTELNKPKLKEILNNDLLHLISEDIIYYQRELKSQRNVKSECQYEKKKAIDGNYYGLKCAPKSSPEFQEFRIWQDIHNLKVLQREGTKTRLINGEKKEFNIIDIDVTTSFIDECIKEKLFELFDNSDKITENQIFTLINENAETKISKKTHRINMFFEGKDSLQGNETKDFFRKIFRKTNYEEEGEEILNDKQKFYSLWNVLYSISLNDEERTKEAICKALTSKTNRNGKDKKIVFNFPKNVAKIFSEAPEIENTKKYASYSSKAINKLLPLMRCGKFWDESLIEESIKIKTEKIKIRLDDINNDTNRIQNISDNDIPQQILKSFIYQKNFISGLKTHQACYLVYDRHSEKSDYTKYTDLEEFDIMRLVPNNSLRNPIVEQVVRESLFVVKDLWQQYGQPDEIHIEIGRDLKKNAKERRKSTEKTTSNATERKRIKELLKELMNDEFEQYTENGTTETVRFETKPNPESPIDIKKFTLWKNASGLNDVDFTKKVKEEKIPKNQELKKYALWLSQKCTSPYTGKIIPLSKLFTPEYEIEHILPRGLIKNDSLDNLVIAESGVNKAKNRELGALFIANRNGGCEHQGKKYDLLKYDDYVAHCKRTFRGSKLKNLLATEIPEGFIERQINDTRYINRKISELLYPVAKGNLKATIDAEKGGIIFTIGAITDELKRNWGLNKEWKKLIKPRFERLEKLNNKVYIQQNKLDRNDIDFNVAENENLSIKRIDHRHHALDALIIAATTREHIRYLNSLSAVDNDNELKQVKRCLVKGKIREFQLPWENFTKEVREQLQQTIVTFKSNNNVISKPMNKYQKWELINGEWKKIAVKQVTNKKWLAVRQSLFDEQPLGVVYLKEIQIKSFRTLREIMSIVKLQIERDEAQNTCKQKTASYIYDQETREIIKKLIFQAGGNKSKIEQDLKRYLKFYKSLKDSNGVPIYTIRIAVFTPYVAKRTSLDNSFNHGIIDKIPYGNKLRMSDDKKMTIPQILHEHLQSYERIKLNDKNYNYTDYSNLSKEDKEAFDKQNGEKLKEALKEAFSDEGLEALDKKIGMKIRSVTRLDGKIEGSKKIIFRDKVVQSANNPYFVFYENEQTKERLNFTSISTYDFIQKRLKNEPILEPKDGFRIVTLQTNDLVYVPTSEECESIKTGKSENEVIDWRNKVHIARRLFRVNDFSKTDIYFKPHTFAKAIKSKELHSSFDDKCSRFINFEHPDNEAILIKDICIKVKVDRLGNILIDENTYLTNHIDESIKEQGEISIEEFKKTFFDDSEN